MHRKHSSMVASSAMIINEKAPGPSATPHNTILRRNSGIPQSLLHSFPFVTLPGYPPPIDWAAT